MEAVTLEGLIANATPYEAWRAPLDGRLRRAVILSGASMATTLVSLWALGHLMSLSKSGFFLVLGPELGGLLSLLYQARPALILINVGSCAAYLALAAGTRGFREGRARWHWVAFGEVLVGVVNAFVLSLELAIVLMNLALWLLIGAAALAALVGLATSSANSSR